MEKFLVISVTFVLFLIFQLSLEESCRVCQTSECFRVAQLLLNSIDNDANPCDNFYQYACGNWPKNNKLKENNIPSSSIMNRAEANQKEILDFLKQNNSINEPKSVHKARKLFQLCLNGEVKNPKGLQTVKDVLTKVGLPISPPTDTIVNFDYVETMIKTYKIMGENLFFSIGVDSDPHNRSVNILAITKPSMDPSFSTFPKTLLGSVMRSSVDSLEKVSYFQFINEVLKLMCENQTTQSCNNLKKPLNLFHNKALIEFISTENKRTQLIIRSYPKLNSMFAIYTLQELQDLTDKLNNGKIQNSLNWTKSFELLFENMTDLSLDLNNRSAIKVLVHEEEFLKQMIQFIHSKSSYDLALNMWWQIVTTLLPYSGEKISKLFEQMYLTYAGIVPNREKKCTNMVAATMGMAVSYYYTTVPRYNKTKIEVSEIVQNIKEGFKNLIQHASWMDSKSKAKSLKKIESLKSAVAFPDNIAFTDSLDKFYDYVNITDNFFDSVLSKVKLDLKNELIRINQINDPDEDRWILTPNIVNAYYQPNKNTITIPAGILGEPVYGHGLKALDYGSIGTILGHEITHGFDNSGRKFNDLGNVEDWWEPETLATFTDRVNCYVDAYTNYSLDFNGVSIKSDSELTFSENIADNGGFKEALLAYRKYVLQHGEEPLLPKFEDLTSDQLFTLGFGQVWCEHPIKFISELESLTDHSSSGIRVNGVLRNSEEFAEIWKCPLGSNMNPNKKKCKVW